MTTAAIHQREEARHERDLNDLRFGEQFVVWALRAWVHNNQCETGQEVAIDTGFRLARIEPALATLTFFMRLLQRTARRQIEVRCIHCRAVSWDEELLMHTIGALQSGDHSQAHIVLHHFLPCHSVRPAAWPLEAFAERLLASRLVVRANSTGRAHVEGLALDLGLHSFALH